MKTRLKSRKKQPFGHSITCLKWLIPIWPVIYENNPVVLLIVVRYDFIFPVYFNLQQSMICPLNFFFFYTEMSSLIRQNFHQDCEAAVNRQINLELYASYVYLSMVRDALKWAFCYWSHVSIYKKINKHVFTVSIFRPTILTGMISPCQILPSSLAHSLKRSVSMQRSWWVCRTNVEAGSFSRTSRCVQTLTNVPQRAKADFNVFFYVFSRLT